MFLASYNIDTSGLILVFFTSFVSWKNIKSHDLSVASCHVFVVLVPVDICGPFAIHFNQTVPAFSVRLFKGSQHRHTVDGMAA